MSTIHEIIVGQIKKHRLAWAFADYKERCRCGVFSDDHEEHVAKMVEEAVTGILEAQGMQKVAVAIDAQTRLLTTMLNHPSHRSDEIMKTMNEIKINDRFRDLAHGMASSSTDGN